jgi:hypothetical protein
MKTKEQFQTKSTVTRKLREIRDRLNLKMKDMSHDQIKEYLKNEKTLHPASVWNSALPKA